MRAEGLLYVFACLHQHSFNLLAAKPKQTFIADWESLKKRNPRTRLVLLHGIRRT
jgi:hypothetical protein